MPAASRTTGLEPKLSTGPALAGPPPVEDLSPATDIWLGAVVPKRHARQAVTRTLLKRQIRTLVVGHAEALARGLWVIRLRAPFDKSAFPSAASDALKCAARDELEQLLVAVAHRAGRN